MLRKSEKGDGVWRQTFAHSLGDYTSLYQDHKTGTPANPGIDSEETRLMLVREKNDQKREANKKQQHESRMENNKACAAINDPNTPVEVYRSDLCAEAIEAHYACRFTVDRIDCYGPWVLLGVLLRGTRTVVSAEGVESEIRVGDLCHKKNLRHKASLVIGLR